MTLEQINYFVLAAETLNFTEVAKQTFTTQPTVSRQISLLEAELGYPLFESKRKGMRLTEPGKYLYSELKKSVDIIQKAIQTARHITKNYFGSLKIGSMVENWTEKLYLSVLQDLKQTCPTIQISYEKRSYYELLKLLEEDKLDIMFAYNFDPVDQRIYKCYDMGTVNAHLILHRNHPLLEAAREDYRVLKNEHFYFLGDPKYYGAAVEELQLPEDHVHIVDSYESAIVNEGTSETEILRYYQNNQKSLSFILLMFGNSLSHA